MTTIEIQAYDLPDKELMDNTRDFRYLIWQPASTVLVLGQSNNADTSLNVAAVSQDGIDVYKRPSGGETVVLTTNTLVISLAFCTGNFQNPKQYFEKINQSIIRALSNLGVKDLFFKGISDIAIGNRKILGSSIYRRKDRVFYHAVLNISESVETIEKYINHPSREPDYRKGRSHGEFVTSLSEQGFHISFTRIKEKIETTLENLEFFG